MSYLAFTQSGYLSEFAETSKELLPTLENIGILDDEEYEKLIKHYLSGLKASNVPVIITGSCYLKLIFENDRERFKNHIGKCIADDYDVLNNFYDYNDMVPAIRLCDLGLFKQFLIKLSGSSNEEIRADVKDYLDNFDEIISASPSYKSYCEEYENFKFKISEDQQEG